MSIDIVLPFYNRADLVVRCLASLKAADLPGDTGLILLNDGSKAAEAAEVRQCLDGLNHRWLEHRENQGFRLAVQTSMAATQARYVLLLNSDTVVSPHFLDALLAAATQVNAAAVAPVTNARNDLFQYRDTGETFGSGDLLTEVVRVARAWARDHVSQRREAAYLTGSCLFLERAAFEAVGYFDSAYAHGYFEDLDLCCRLRQAGRKLLIAEDCFVYHQGNGSYQHLGAGRRREIVTANYQTFCRHWSHLPEHGELTALLTRLGAKTAAG